MSPRRDQVLSALRSAGDAGVSGEALAHDLGVSRAAIAKHVRALRDLGYEVAARPGSGYVLQSTPDLPLAEEVRPLLASEMWVDLRGVACTGSTNDDCKQLARAGATEGTVVIATEQSTGRGRLGRTWDSPSGGVYISALLRPEMALAELAPLPLVVSLGVARGLEALGVASALKWPNDVLMGGEKVAGILLESSAESDRAEWVVAGVGVNVRRPKRAFEGAAYLDDATDVTLAVVAASVLDGIAEAYGRFCVAGFDGLVAEYEQRSSLHGRDVTVRDISGAVRAAGRVEGIDALGRLVVQGPDGPSTVSAGDVSLAIASDGHPERK